MESTLYFMVSINDFLKKMPDLRLKGVYTFWNRMVSRERQDLLSAYEDAILELGLSAMQTRIPQSVKYDREQSINGSENLFLSTVFPPDKPLLKGSNWEEFMNEFLQLTMFSKV
jgi:hypothetical protein